MNDDQNIDKDEPPTPTPCRSCIFFDRPPAGLTPPVGSTERDRVTYLNAGRCRSGTPAPSPTQSGFTHWPLVMRHSSCGNGKAPSADDEERPKCQDCRFFYRPPLGILPPPNASDAVRQRYEGAGFCHNQSPGVATSDHEFPRWPMVRRTDWCSSAQRGDLLPIGLPSKPIS